MSTNNRNPGEIPAHLLEQADLARLTREPAQALIWLNTAALLDSAEEKTDVKGKVNSRLLALIFDATAYSEALALRCGNFTKQHAGWLQNMQEAHGLLQSRLSASGSADQNALTALIGGNLTSLTKRFERELGDSNALANYPTEVRHIVQLLQSLRTISGAVARLADGTLEVKRTAHSSMLLIDTLIGNADSHITCRLLSILTSWEHAQFYTSEAVKAANELNGADPDFEGSNEDLAALRSNLEEALRVIGAKDRVASKTALASSRRLLRKLGFLPAPLGL
jgi:hypothetical protein